MCLLSWCCACSNWISGCLLHHTTGIGQLTGVSWLTRWGARWPQSLTNVPQHIGKFARHLSSLNVPRTTCSQQLLLCVQSQTSHCTVKPTMTAAWITVTFIGLFCHWLCLVWWSLAPWLDSASVLIVKWWIFIFTIVVPPHYKAAHQCTYSRLSLPQHPKQIGWNKVVISGFIKSESDHLQVTVRIVHVKNQIWETKRICLQSEQAWS